MRPGGIRPSENSELGKAITKKFGSFESFEEEMKIINMYIQDKGWGWLAYNKKTDDLELRVSNGHDLLSSQDANLVPLLTMNIWETTALWK